MRRVRSDRPTSITTAPESISAELRRRQRRYAFMAAIFISSFTSAALLHRHTVLALSLCGLAAVTLVLAVIGANIRSPRRPGRPAHVVSESRQLRSSPDNRPSGE